MTPRKGRAKDAAGDWTREAAGALAADAALAPLIERFGPPALRPPAETHFGALVRAIVYQQLGGKAAATIHGRVLEALGGEVTPDALLALPEERLRGAGLSRAKTAAALDLAARVGSGEVPLEGVGALSDDEIVASLVRVRGIGTWSAQMFLIFQLRRPDVWPVTDLGVRAGYARLHSLGDLPSPRELEGLGDRYRPWRSAAAWYCWRALEASREKA